MTAALGSGMTNAMLLRIADHRAARVLAGRAALLFLGGWPLLAVARVTATTGELGFRRGAGTEALVGAWLLGALAYAVRAWRPGLAPGGIALDRRDAALAGDEARSVGWPLAAISFLLPLTLQLLFVGMGALHGEEWRRYPEYDVWIGMSAVLVGHCHLYLAARAWSYGRDLQRTPAPDLRRTARLAFGRTYGLTVAMSVLPGGFLMMIPPILVAVTGVVYYPLYAGFARLIQTERALLERAQAGLPQAEISRVAS